MKESEKSTLAYLLNEELFKTSNEFMKKHPETDPSVILSAGALYIASLITQASTKEKALETLDGCVELIHSVINITPDHFFG